MVPAAGNIKHGVEVGRLAGGKQHSRRAALQGADFGGDGVVGGVLQAGIEITAGLQIEQSAHILAGFVAEGGGLDDGEVPRLSVAGAVARVEAVGCHLIAAHGAFLLSFIDGLYFTRLLGG